MLCQALQLSSLPACSWGVLSSVLLSENGMRAQLDSLQVIDLAIEEFSMSLPKKKSLGLLSNYALVPSAL